MKVIVTTSNKYLHILPIFCYLFNKYWSKDQQVEIVGYDQPEFKLPDNFSFYSLGKQSEHTIHFSNDLRKYFEKQDQFFIWSMEDTFIKSLVKLDKLEIAKSLIQVPFVGRIALTNDSFKHYTLFWDVINDVHIYETPHLSIYRLSTQIAIWNKDYLLKYLTPNLTPWRFECQETGYDDFHNFTLQKEHVPISHNEGVRKHDLFKYNFDGIDESVLNEMKELNLITNG